MKRILIMLLALVMMLSFVACSAKKDADGDENDKADTTDSASVADPAASEDETEETEVREKRPVYTGYTRTDGTTGDVTVMEKYVYDGVRLVSATTNEGTMTLTYDEAAKSAVTSIGNLTEYKMIWDDKGNIVTNSHTYESGYTATYTFTYDSEGRPLGSFGMSDGKEINKVEYTYDERGNKLTEVYYTDDGTNTVNARWEYDDKGNMVKRTTLDSEEVYTNTYDEKGDLIKSENSDGSMHEYTYDGNGNVLTRSYYNSEGRFSNRREYTYYPSGDLHTESYYGSGGSLEYTYTYNYADIEMTDAEYRTAEHLIDIFLKDL